MSGVDRRDVFLVAGYCLVACFLFIVFVNIKVGQFTIQPNSYTSIPLFFQKEMLMLRIDL